MSTKFDLKEIERRANYAAFQDGLTEIFMGLFLFFYGGTLAINAIHMSRIPEMPYSLIYGERTLRSVANATFQDGIEFLNLAAAMPIVSTVKSYALEDANQALSDIKHSKINGEAVLRI